MNKNFLLGLIIGGVAVAASVLVKKTEKRYISVEETNDNGETVVNQKEVEEPVFTKEKIKAVFTKENMKAQCEKAMNYIVANQDKVQAVTCCVGLLTAFINFRNAVNNSRKSKRMTDVACDLMEQIADSCSCA